MSDTYGPKAVPLGLPVESDFRPQGDCATRITCRRLALGFDKTDPSGRLFNSLRTPRRCKSVARNPTRRDWTNLTGETLRIDSEKSACKRHRPQLCRLLRDSGYIIFGAYQLSSAACQTEAAKLNG